MTAGGDGRIRTGEGTPVDGGDVFGGIIGQDRPVSLLREMAHHPVHAYLFTGPPGVGKEEAAVSFGASLLCDTAGCGSCWNCTAAMDRRHPDLVVLERSGAAISVDQARQVSLLSMRRPSVARRLVVVLPDFHLVDEAAPALLKSIEEPPPSTVFLVLADQVTPRLVTVASRCVEVAFHALSPETVARTLVTEGFGADEARRSAEMSGGRLDRARRAGSDPGIRARHELFATIPARLDGTGSSIDTITSELVGAVDDASESLRAVQEAELAEALTAAGEGRDAPAKADIVARHRREVRRARTEELRFGLGALAQSYRERCVPTTPHTERTATPVWGVRGGAEAVEIIDAASRALDRNPNETLLLQALLLRLSALDR